MDDIVLGLCAFLGGLFGAFIWTSLAIWKVSQLEGRVQSLYNRQAGAQGVNARANIESEALAAVMELAVTDFTGKDVTAVIADTAKAHPALALHLVKQGLRLK